MSGHHSDETATIDRVPDAAATNLDAVFESQWRKNLFDVAVDRVRPRFSLKQFQIFDLVVLREWPAATVTQALGVSIANVYVTRHRISSAIKKETRRLEDDSKKKVCVKLIRNYVFVALATLFIAQLASDHVGGSPWS